MFSRYIIRIINITIILLLFALPLYAMSINVDLKNPQVRVLSPELSEDAYILNIVVPDDVIGKRLDAVLLEFYVDVSLKEDVIYSQSPVIEIYPLETEYDGVSIPRFIEAPSMVRNVRVGDGKMVIVNITDIIKHWISNPGSNKGIIIGSLTKSKKGIFNLRTDRYGNEIIAKVRYCFQNRFGNQVSSGHVN